ncbi:hypothetical protein GGI24_003833, partial [Coemansia furcata]
VGRVPADLRVEVMLMKILVEKATAYYHWCEMEKQMTTDMGALQVFLLKEYAGSLSRFDSFIKWVELAGPTSVASLSTFTQEFKQLAQACGLESTHFVLDFMYAKKMPHALYQRIFANSTNNSQITLAETQALAHTHFRSLGLHSNSMAMDVDAMTALPAAVDGIRHGQRGPSRLPGYSYLKDVCTQAEYLE